MGSPNIDAYKTLEYKPISFTELIRSKIQTQLKKIEIGSSKNGLNGADKNGFVDSAFDTVMLTQCSNTDNKKPIKAATTNSQNTTQTNVKNSYTISYTDNTEKLKNNNEIAPPMYEKAATFELKSLDGGTHKINISVDSDIEGDYLKDLEKTLQNLPDEVVNIMIKENISNIRIEEPRYKYANGCKTTDLRTKAEYDGETNSITFFYGRQGGFDYNHNSINGISAQNLTHEIAHAIDYQKGSFASVIDDKTKTEMESNFDELTKLLEESNISTYDEKENTSFYCLTNPMEYLTEKLTDKFGFESSYTRLKNSIKGAPNEAKINEILAKLDTNCDNILRTADFNKTDDAINKELQQLEEYAQKNSDYELNAVKGNSEWLLGKIEINSENPSLDILKELYKNKYMQQDSEIIAKIKNFLKNNPQYESVWKRIDQYLDAPCQEFINTNKK